MIRLFVAIELPGEVRDRLAMLGAGVENARWVPPENLHLSLRFIGEVHEPVVEDIIPALSRIRMKPFALTLSGAGHFESGKRVRALWVGVEKSPPLINLQERIEAALARAGVLELAVVIPVHSHYDHAMDAPEVARRTGALLLGSESTANIGRGWGLPESRIRVAEPGRSYAFGAFEVTLIPSRHVNFGLNARTLGGAVREPLVPPARATAYAEGVSWSVHVAHPSGSLLVQGSAGFVPGALRRHPADVVLLGVGGLGRLDAGYRDAYLAEVVEATQAKLVIPVHYDDFTRPLARPLPLMPSLLADFPAVMRQLRGWTQRRPGCRLALLRVFEPVRIFAAQRAASAI